MGLRAREVAVVLCLAAAVPAFGYAAQKPKKSSQKPHAKKVAAQPLPPMPSGPLPQMPLDSVPAVAPQVSYADGNLTILAHNSNLTDILKAVQARTGASIDVPSNATERVVTNLGPGPARDVLAKLLNGSHYNYVMLGSESDPNAVSKIVLTSKATAAPPDGPSAASQAAALQPQPQVYQNMPQPAQVMPPPNPEAAAESDGEEPEPEPEAEEGNDPAEQQDQDGAVAPAAETPAAPGQGAPKTPEQLLQELQRQQLLLQQQQQQQQQPGEPGQPPPPNVPNQPPQR